MKKITKISNRIIRRFDPCYDPSELGSKESEYLPIVEAVEKYRDKCKNKEDFVWLLCRKEFMTEKDMRLFAVWCAREALKLLENPDQRSLNACDVAERFANGEATSDELDAAWAAAGSAAWDAAGAAARYAARSAAWAAAGSAAGAAARAAASDAAWAAASDAAWAAAWDAASDEASDEARDAQIDKLLTYFK
jgi:hypothetical protein